MEEDEAGVAISGGGGELPGVLITPDEEDVRDDGENEETPGRGQGATVRGEKGGDGQADVAEDSEWEGEINERQRNAPIGDQESSNGGGCLVGEYRTPDSSLPIA